MRFAKRHRGWLALIAAYALALQGLVTAFAAPALALGPALTLCSPGGSQPAGDPASADHHGDCCLAGGCAAGLGCAPSVGPVSWTGGATAAPVVPLHAVAWTPSRPEWPHNSRAPPLA